MELDETLNVVNLAHPSLRRFSMSSAFYPEHSPYFILIHVVLCRFAYREYFFGGMGIESCGPGETVMGEPMQIVQLGQTEIPYALFLEYIFELGESSFKVSNFCPSHRM